ncbi:MAG: prohibitin family protein [Helicobacter sp.]|nr:prohibitin family protein [Helicobacter sp.]
MPIDLNEHLKKKWNERKDKESDDSEIWGNKKPPNGGGDKNNKGGSNFNFELNIRPTKKLVFLYAFVGLLVLFFVVRPFTIINAGEVGIRVTTGKFDTTPLYPNIHFYFPGFQRIIVVDSRVKILNFSNGEEGASARSEATIYRPAIQTLDNKGLPVYIDLTVQYALNPEFVSETISEYTQNWEQRIIIEPIQEIARNVIGGYTAEELPGKRDEIAAKVATLMTKNLQALKNPLAELRSIQLKSILLPPSVQEQIQRVQVAKQEAERVRNEVERTKQEAEKVAAQARGEAEAKRINAQGNADAILIEAKAQAQANQVIGDSLSRQLLDLRQIEVQGKFNEALRENKDAKIFLTPGGSTPNLWIDSKSNKP